MTKGVKILLIEDHLNLRQAIQIYLEGAGYEVWPTGNFEGFGEALDQITPDLAIVDLEFPRAPGRKPERLGLVAQAELRGLNVPVLGISAAVLIPEGFGDEFLGKPFDLNEFLAAVEGLLGKEVGR